MTLTRGAGTFSFGRIWFGSEDIGKTYVYTIRERAGQNACISYDDRVYSLTAEVVWDEETGSVRCITSLSAGGREASEIVFTNVFHNIPPETPPYLPQNGQLWWPVTVLALGGVLLILAGSILSRIRS